MNEELKKKIGEVADAFRAAGMSDVPYQVYDADTVRLYFKESARKTYLGTYLNTFSVLEGKVEPCPLWSDETASESAEVVVGPVYRHNGAAEDVSVSVWFYPRHATVSAWPEKFDYQLRKDPVYVAYVKEHSPFDYLSHPETLVNVGGCCIPERTAKLSKTSGKKAVANAVEKTMALVRAFVPNDHSKWAKDPKDYHADTSREHLAWVREQKRMRGLAV